MDDHEDEDEKTALDLDVDSTGLTLDPSDDEESETVERRLPVLGGDDPEDEPLPADEEQPTALVAPETLRRELEKSREGAALAAEPAHIAEPAPFVLTGEAQVARLMASSIDRSRHELPTAPAPFPIVELDKLPTPRDVPAAGPGGTVVIPKSTLAEVLARAPKVTEKMAGAPDLVGHGPTPWTAEPIRPPSRRSRVPLVLLVLVAAIIGVAVSVVLLRAPPH